MKHIIDDRADILNLNNEELYLAGRLYNLEPFAMEQYNGGELPTVSPTSPVQRSSQISAGPFERRMHAIDFFV